MMMMMMMMMMILERIMAYANSDGGSLAQSSMWVAFFFSQIPREVPHLVKVIRWPKRLQQMSDASANLQIPKLKQNK